MSSHMTEIVRRCAGCKWCFRCPSNQSDRIQCRACESKTK
jgi:hypothetical protein